jgi:hypothetical protein
VSIVSAAEAAIRRAAEALGARVLRCEQISVGRTGVYRVHLSNDTPKRDGDNRLPAGLGIVAARITPTDPSASGPVTNQRDGRHGVRRADW